MHKSNWIRRTILFAVVEREPHSEDTRAVEVFVKIGHKRGGIIVTPGVEEVGSDEWDRLAVKIKRTGGYALEDVDNADHHGRLSWPLVAPPRGVDRASMLADPTKTRASRIPLGNGVRGY